MRGKMAISAYIFEKSRKGPIFKADFLTSKFWIFVITFQLP